MSLRQRNREIAANEWQLGDIHAPVNGVTASRAKPSQIARRRGQRPVFGVATCRNYGLAARNAKNLAGPTGSPFCGSTRRQISTQRLAGNQVRTSVIATLEPCLQPAAHRASINTQTAGGFVDRVAAMDLDPPRIDLPPLERLHGFTDDDAGLAAQLRVAVTRP